MAYITLKLVTNVLTGEPGTYYSVYYDDGDLILGTYNEKYAIEKCRYYSGLEEEHRLEKFKKEEAARQQQELREQKKEIPIVINVTNSEGQYDMLLSLTIPSGKVEIKVQPPMIDEEAIDEIYIDPNHIPYSLISSGITNKISDYIETQVQSLIEKEGANVLSSLGINEETILFAEKLISIGDSVVNKAKTIISIIPKNVHIIPSPRVALGDIYSTLKDKFIAIYMLVCMEYYATVNEAILNVPPNELIMLEALQMIRDYINDLIDKQCMQYTGYTQVELIYMCKQYLALFKMYTLTIKARRELSKEEKKKRKENIESALSELEAVENGEESVDEPTDNDAAIIGDTEEDNPQSTEQSEGDNPSNPDETSAPVEAAEPEVQTLTIGGRTMEIPKILISPGLGGLSTNDSQSEDILQDEDNSIAVGDYLMLPVKTLSRKRLLSISGNPFAIKVELLRSLQESTDIIYNSFMILLVKEAVEELIKLARQLHNVDLRVLADGVNNVDDVVNILKELGANQESNLVTIKEAIENGINNFGSEINSLKSAIQEELLTAATNVGTTIYETTEIEKAGKDQIFDISGDFETKTLTLNIYVDPTGKKFRNKLTKVLRKATSSDGTPTFSGNDIVNVLNYVDQGFKAKADTSVRLNKLRMNIHYEMPDFNLSWTERRDKIATDVWQQMERLKLLEADIAEYAFINDIVTEEYTEDADAIKTRPTLLLTHELYCLLNELVPIFKMFTEIIINFKTNKEAVFLNCLKLLALMSKRRAKQKGLNKSADIKGKNFYTVRTLKLYNHILTNIKNQPDNIIELDVPQTLLLYTYLLNNDLDHDQIDVSLETVLYIDMDAINELQETVSESISAFTELFGEDANLFTQDIYTQYTDGPALSIDKIEMSENTIYYTDSSLSMYPSQIMYCYANDFDINI